MKLAWLAAGFAVIGASLLVNPAKAEPIGPTSPYYLDNYSTQQIYVVQARDSRQ